MTSVRTDSLAIVGRREACGIRHSHLPVLASGRAGPAVRLHILDTVLGEALRPPPLPGSGLGYGLGFV